MPRVRGGDQALAEGRGMDPVADGHACAARSVLARRNGFSGDKKLVQAAQARKSELMRGVQQVFRTVEQFLRAFLCQELHEALRTDSRPAREDPLEVGFAQTEICRQFLDARLVLIMVFKVQDRLLDAQVIVGKLFKFCVHSFSF
jgi:hypothetical protein